MKRVSSVGFVVGFASHLASHSSLSDQPFRHIAPTKDLVLPEDEV